MIDLDNIVQAIPLIPYVKYTDCQLMSVIFLPGQGFEKGFVPSHCKVCKVSHYNLQFLLSRTHCRICSQTGLCSLQDQIVRRVVSSSLFVNNCLRSTRTGVLARVANWHIVLVSLK